MRETKQPKRAGELSDAALVDAVRSGSVDCFGELYRRHAPGVRAAISDNVRDPEGQLDLVQETFTRALGRLDSLRDADRFRPWVLQIARNAAIDSRRNRNATAPVSLDDDTSPEPQSPDAGPDLQAEVRELAAALESGMALLSPRDAAALSLTVHLDLGPRDVAAALDITYGNAKVLLHRARRRLYAALEQRDLLDRAAEA